MRNRARKNYVIYVLMLLLFGGLIYVAIEEGDRFSHYAVNAQNMVQGNPFTMFLQFIQDNLHHPLPYSAFSFRMLFISFFRHTRLPILNC